MSLIAIYAQELSHYLICTFNEPPPGGIDYLEIVVELTAIYLGFGIFKYNSALCFEQNMKGSIAPGSGFLTEMQISFALSIFLEVKNIDIDVVSPFLKTQSVTSLERSINILRSQKYASEIMSLKNV